jgi:hypothetical protein
MKVAVMVRETVMVNVVSWVALKTSERGRGRKEEKVVGEVDERSVVWLVFVFGCGGEGTSRPGRTRLVVAIAVAVVVVVQEGVGQSVLNGDG